MSEGFCSRCDITGGQQPAYHRRAYLFARRCESRHTDNLHTCLLTDGAIGLYTTRTIRSETVVIAYHKHTHTTFIMQSLHELSGSKTPKRPVKVEHTHALYTKIKQQTLFLLRTGYQPGRTFRGYDFERMTAESDNHGGQSALTALTNEAFHHKAVPEMHTIEHPHRSHIAAGCFLLLRHNGLL